MQIENAYVPGAHRAFVHRSHSGRYGLVNSEEGFQNLWRFLFGDLRVDVTLVHLRLPGSREDDVVWQLDTQLSIRGLPIIVHEQTAEHHCPIQLEWPSDGDSVDRPVPLLTTFLSASASRPTGELRYALHLRLISSVERSRTLDPFDHLEQVADFDDTLVVDIRPGGANQLPRAWAAWNSVIPGAIRDWSPSGQPLDDLDTTPDRWISEVSMPETTTVFGPAAALRVTLTPWNRVSQSESAGGESG